MVYDWKFHMAVDAQEVGEYFEELETEHGQVTPKSVLESARPKGSLLHPCFEWDDGIAAEKYREDQAGRIIRNLVVRVERAEEQKEPVQVRAFVNIKTETKSIYLPIAKVLSEDSFRQQMLDTAWGELRAFRIKYSDLKELSGVFSLIDGLDLGE